MKLKLAHLFSTLAHIQLWFSAKSLLFKEMEWMDLKACLHLKFLLRFYKYRCDFCFINSDGCERICSDEAGHLEFIYIPSHVSEE